MTLSEREEATILANRILDNPALDPDSDLSMMSRQFLRSEERLAGHPDQRWGCISYAQHGDDFMLLNLFNLLGIHKPSYLDLGAHHPTHISNTRLLYERGSRGINVEANPNLIEAFKRERPEDINLNIGVSLIAGKADFYMFSDTSGRNTFSPREVELERGLEIKSTVRLPVTTVNEIVTKYWGSWPALLTCDIEGLDFDVLNSAIFTPTDAPLVICVETRRHENTAMSYMLRSKGYFQYCRMGENCFFVRQTLSELVY